MDPEVWSSRKRKSAVLDPERAGGFFCFVGFVDEDLKLVRGKYSFADLIQNLQSAEELLD